MRLPAALAAVFSLAAPVEAQQVPAPQRVAPPIVHETTPALGAYTDAVLFGDVWKRTELTPRDRSVVTIAALVAGGHTRQMTAHFNRGLDNGVTPSEIAGIITHQAFYAGWPRAISAVGVAKEVFAAAWRRTRRRSPRHPARRWPLTRPPRRSARLPSRRSPARYPRPSSTVYQPRAVRRPVAARRPCPRDRSLVTIVALIANGQVDQLAFHMNGGWTTA